MANEVEAEGETGRESSTSPPARHLVFISHSSQDARVAEAVCAYLENAGMKCWLAPRDVMAGRPYSGQITEAIRSAQILLLILSQQSNRSKQVLREVERAAHCQIRLLTFRINRVEPNDDLAYFLGIDHWLDANAGPVENYYAALSHQVVALLQAPAVSETPGEEVTPEGPEIFANFRILRKPDGSLYRLGKGGMGVAWKAVDVNLDRPVALKVIGADLLGSVSARQRFLREAQAAAKIQHPHVATVYQFGQEGDSYFYAMEFVEGEDLERYVAAHGPLTPTVALRVVVQVAQALDAAQVHRLVHRDIKPTNLMATVNQDGLINVKLIDFGLAKGTTNQGSDVARITRTQDFVGSPAFASPEQCEMAELDTRSDIYSLGVTLWYLLSGKRPFSGTVGQVMIAHAVKPPPFQELTGVPEPLIALLRRMLAKNPADRPQTPRQLQGEAEAVAAQLSGGFAAVSEPVSTGVAPIEAPALAIERDSMPTIVSPYFDPYFKVEIGDLIAGRYRLVEEQPEGVGGRLFLADDQSAGPKRPGQLALKLLHPAVSSNAEVLDLLEHELGVTKRALHPQLIQYFDLEREQDSPFLLLDWVHGFSLYDLLRWRGSLTGEELRVLLEPLAGVLDFVSQSGFGLVEVSARKIMVSCPLDLPADRFAELGRKDVREWTGRSLKLNPISLAPLLYRHRINRPQLTLVPTSQALSLTQVEAGIQGSKAVRLFAKLIYELLGGRLSRQTDGSHYTALPELGEAGNTTLRQACIVTGEPLAYKTCSDFWRALSSGLKERVAVQSPRSTSGTVENVSLAPTKVETSSGQGASGVLSPRKDTVHEPVPHSAETKPKPIPNRNRTLLLILGAIGIVTLGVLLGIWVARAPHSRGTAELAAVSPPQTPSVSVVVQPSVSPIVVQVSPPQTPSVSVVVQPPKSPSPEATSVTQIASPAATPSPVAQPTARIPSGVTIHLAADNDIGVGGRWTRTHAEEWARETHNTVGYLSRPNDASETLEQYQQYWAAKSPDIDVYMIDVIWPGIAAPHAVDLKKYFTADEIKEHFQQIIDNNTVNGKLVGLPFFCDAGLLYYRTDLLQKYGYQGPPKTWQELAEMAKKIQDGERSEGNKNFQGFVFQGKASESLTCNAVEWIYSFGGGSIIEQNKQVSINNPNAIRALDTARGWVGSISPTGVTTYGEEEARNVWQQGNAAFMRNWPYAYYLGEDSRSAVAGKFAITVLPKGGVNGRNAACLGGWQLMVSAYAKHPEVAADLVRYLCSEAAQKKRAIELGQLPTRPALYRDQEVLATYSWFANALDALSNSVARPSTPVGADYNQVATAIFQNTNKVLTGTQNGKDAVIQIERVAKRVLR